MDILKKSSFFIGIGFVILLFFLISTKNDQSLEEVDFSSNEPAPNKDSNVNTDAKVMVDIKGEVNKPGVYEMDMDSRVNDVIHLAGGFSNDADETVINLAQKIHDEMIIIVPKLGDLDSGANNSQDQKLRINYASQEEIETLQGIGPSKAQAIIQYREENGLFQQIEDLLNVSGIGEKTLENIEEFIQLP